MIENEGDEERDEGDDWSWRGCGPPACHRAVDQDAAAARGAAGDGACGRDGGEGDMSGEAEARNEDKRSQALFIPSVQIPLYTLPGEQGLFKKAPDGTFERQAADDPVYQCRHGVD
eukprot:755299-Hanusia_phi.AAC.7